MTASDIKNRVGSVHGSIHVFLSLAALLYRDDSRVGCRHVQVDIALGGAELRVPYDLLDTRRRCSRGQELLPWCACRNRVSGKDTPKALTFFGKLGPRAFSMIGSVI